MNRWQSLFLDALLTHSSFWSPANGAFLHSQLFHCGEGISGYVWDARQTIGRVPFYEALGGWFVGKRTTSHFVGCTLLEAVPFDCARYEP